jgi:hypothetical protein
MPTTHFLTTILRALIKRGVGRPASLTPPFFPNSLSLRQSARLDILVVCHGSWRFLAVAPVLGEGFQDRVPQRPGGGHSPWALEEVLRRWGGTIPLVAQVTEGAAARLIGG